MFESMQIRGREIRPALFLAPMAGVTHSAFRRLLSDFGGYGALYTEMLSATAFLKEDLERSPFTRRRPQEGPVIYQFRTSGTEDLDRLLERLRGLDCAALDLNLGCPAPKIRAQASGVALFRDFERLKGLLERIRARYDGPLTLKCRLGDDPETWRQPFLERLRLFESMGVDALAVHPRLAGEKLKRRARWEEFPWIAERTAIPLIGNGDVCSPRDVQEHRACFEPLAGLMLGRIVAVKPWIFREFAGLPAAPVDHLEVWERFCAYVEEDFPPERVLGRLLEFAFYYAKNFRFGHAFFSALQGATNVEEARRRARSFLEAAPELRAGTDLAFT